MAARGEEHHEAAIAPDNLGSVLLERWQTIGAELIRLPWDDEVSRAFGERKARLERGGMRMSDFDLAIAAHAIALGLIVVTAGVAFERLGIRRENWLR